jgi:hypothetical protein
MELHDQKLKDILPQPLAALPPAAIEVTALTSGVTAPISPNIHPAGFASRFRKTLQTSRNAFGLFRRYFSQRFPSHDPESELNIPALSNIVPTDVETPSLPSYDPYPNKNSFRLGDWYWNHGVQKSQKSFRELVNIVGDVDFEPSDVRSTNWGKINRTLGGDDHDEWLDDDAGWITTPITISVPFHRRLPDPGPRDYVLTNNFHHRSLVAVIQEKLTKENDIPHFHYEPYELHWQSSNRQPPVRVHGELYTSPAFIDAHNALQESPGEPACELPRVIAALMFWSDATQLTNFGNTKLWPLYMFFGNESKYRRGKPSCNLCEHVAYFEAVRVLCFLTSMIPLRLST